MPYYKARPDSPESGRVYDWATARGIDFARSSSLRDVEAWPPVGVIIVAGLSGMRLAFGAFPAIVALSAKDVLALTGHTRGWYFGLLHLVAWPRPRSWGMCRTVLAVKSSSFQVF